MGDKSEGTGRDRQQGFALEKVEEVAVKDGVDLQRVAAVFDDVGINEARDAALAEEGFAKFPGEGRGIGLR